MEPLSAEELAEFEEASNHPYECECDLCKKWWWVLIGPKEENSE